MAAAFVLVLLAAAGTEAEVTATHDTVITFDSEIFPHVLPRHRAAPVGIRLEAHVKARKKREPAALTSIELGIHRAANLSRRGLPVCDANRIDPASTAMALARCRGARIGYGRIRAQSDFPGTRRFHFSGRVTIFNGRLENGRPAILLHVFSRSPRSSFVFPLRISHSKGRYQTRLTTHVRIGRWSRITDFKLVLSRTYGRGGRRRSYLSASCPAPAQFSIGISPFVVATLGFADRSESRIAVVGSCKVGS